MAYGIITIQIANIQPLCRRCSRKYNQCQSPTWCTDSSFYRSIGSPQPVQLIKKNKQRRARTQIYGYVLTHEWMADYWRRHQLGGPGHGVDIQSKVSLRVLPLAGLTKLYRVRWDGDPDINEAIAVAVGHRKPNGEIKMASLERLDRVKEVLERDDEPSWYEMC